MTEKDWAELADALLDNDHGVSEDGFLALVGAIHLDGFDTLARDISRYVDCASGDGETLRYFFS